MKEREREKRGRERDKCLSDCRGETELWMFVISLGCAENSLPETSEKKFLKRRGCTDVDWPQSGEGCFHPQAEQSP